MTRHLVPKSYVLLSIYLELNLWIVGISRRNLEGDEAIAGISVRNLEGGMH